MNDIEKLMLLVGKSVEVEFQIFQGGCVAVEGRKIGILRYTGDDKFYVEGEGKWPLYFNVDACNDDGGGDISFLDGYDAFSITIYA